MNRYRQTRDYENLQRAFWDGVGPYGIPEIQPVYECDVENWIGFNFAKGCEEPELHGVHFFIDDYQFVRIWKDPDRYTSMLSKFQAVCSPDFSPYADFPKAIQIYNHYRKHWMAFYWQTQGLTVIPTITWSDPSTFDFCFDGEPENSIVALSSVGMSKNPEYRQWMIDGYEEMMKRLKPTKIIWRGQLFPEFESDRDIIFQIPSFTDKWRQSDFTELKNID